MTLTLSPLHFPLQMEQSTPSKEEDLPISTEEKREIKEAEYVDWILAPLCITLLRMNAAHHKIHKEEESVKSFALQLLIPFLFSGSGLLATGILLEHATSHNFFIQIPQSFVVLPVLLGLKGNLEMTFAARLSTLANVGLMETRGEICTVFISNMALIQVQAVVVSSLSVSLSLCVQLLHSDTFIWTHELCLLTTSVSTASLLSFLLGSLILLITVSSKRMNLNADNVTTPLAAALGDLCTLSTMMFLGSLFHSLPPHLHFILILLLLFFFLITLISAVIASRNELTRDVLVHGWWSLVSAMTIGCLSGQILRKALSSYNAIAQLQPLVNGIGGNVSAVHASRISTTLHKETKEKCEDRRQLRTFLNPCRAFFSSENDSIAARVLILLAILTHILFYTLLFLVHPPFVFSLIISFSFITIALIQVIILLFISQYLVRLFWRSRIDPDSSAIPLLTALGDLIGTGLLSLSFFLIYSFYPPHSV